MASSDGTPSAPPMPLFPPTQDEVIEQLERRYNLVHTVIENLKTYKKKSAAAIAAQPALNAVADPVLVGRYTHSHQLNARVQFLSYLLSNSGLMLGKDDVEGKFLFVG